MSKKYVPDGVWLTCSNGTCSSIFKVTFHKETFIYGSSMATEGDRWPFINIKPMGICTTLRSICLPSPVIWQQVKEGVSIGNSRMLLEDSTAKCLFGGTIQIHFTLESALKAAPFSSLKKPSEYIRGWFDEVFKFLDTNIDKVNAELDKSLPGIKMKRDFNLLAWFVQIDVAVVEGVINGAVGTLEALWAIRQDPVGTVTAIGGGIAQGAVEAVDWMSKGDNWKKAGSDTWDYVTSPDKWVETASSAAEWVKNNPRKMGNVEGEILETAAEIYFTVGIATAVKASGKAAGEIGKLGLKEAENILVKEAGKVAEEEIQHTLPKVITKEGAEAAEGMIRSLDDLPSLRGATWEEVESLIPKDWTRVPLNKGEGVKLINPVKKGEQILLEKGWSGAKDPLHAGPYMKISRNGQITRIPLSGNPTLK